MNIQTEKATSRWDLPHAYTEVSSWGAGLQCVCLRGSEHKLHHAPALEKASERFELITEKGI